MMIRADENLAFMLQYENVAWYEDGKVRILDRRIYPAKVEFVTCLKHEEVAQAIADMVTQSAGPYLAAGMGMALAAYECRNKTGEEAEQYLEKAADTLSHARPTTAARMEAITEKCRQVGIEALKKGERMDEAIFLHTLDEINQKYFRLEKTAQYLVELFPDKGTVLTQCFGETIVGMMLKVIRKRGKDMKVMCAETRPYFQGARLTASVAYDQGFDVTVITDNMPAYAMKNGLIDVFTSAADAISCDGYVVNKVGTMQIALVCKYFGIPYFATGAPDLAHPTIDSVQIEMRDPEQVLEAMGIRTAKMGVKGLYPAFDITPPHLVSGIVTNKGVFSPYDIQRYFE
ncbi:MULTISPECIES: s-methyl-5-thioribose-1-phosphate isomerase [Hungatella]|uniref:Methylthioribose-1-phosphate isomerase n=1 Tax=Hungatella hathewayi TaxID=154046 RepID=A0AA37N5Y5_9FIRM|nr:S-methyl-5-thioribose-1-phosphate isomerase [Hungatella hathewayi]RGZ04290.1 s-methyl-5-thioribose-1-phosphate isomerase [Hungatella hathewayi]GKH04553.1 methylthioribose-1-phosphate isomerase [Hungatella hathewayi]GKH07358.1 methylthioribose-1-phosphate isomerase [Hungatella hathewayi]